MEIDALRKKVIDECERCFTPRPLNLDIHRNQPDKVKDAELCRHIVEIAVKNIKEVLYKKFNDTIASISSEKNTDSENTEQSGEVLSPKDRIEKYVNSTCNGYASTRFRNLFKDGLITHAEQKKRAVIATDKFDARTIRKFINRETIPDEKTFDLFSIFLQVGGWNTFKHLIREQQRLNDDNPITPIINIPQSELSSVKRLEIPGATIIDEEFIEEIKKQEFSMIEFYTAIKDSQWLGIVHNCYVERRGYEQLKNAVLESLNQKREYKICGIVHGTGGSGKSTVLRNLCVDIQSFKDCIVTWINDVMEFCQHGISTIKQDLETNNEKKYLIVIEDWYRMLDDKPETASEFLEQLHEYNNIRIVIGDRTIVGKSYDEYGSDYNLLLSSNENKEIIEQIIKKYPNWKEASEKLFESLKNDEPTLFLLLFILARISQENSGKTSVNLSDPLVVFRNIIRSDINFIANKHIGLAKAIYYCACLYTEYKISITYQTFLKIADHYNGNNIISKSYSSWNLKGDPVFNRLKIYLNKEDVYDEYYALQEIIKFNHDLLVSDGLSVLQWKDWDEFGDDNIKIELAEFIIDNGDNYSIHYFFEKTILFFKGEQVFDDNQKMTLIRKIIENYNDTFLYKKGRGIQYLYSAIFALCELPLKDNTIENFAKLLWEKKICAFPFWLKYFQQIKENNLINKNIDNILNIEYLSKYSPDFIKLVLEYSENSDIKSSFINNVLESQYFNDIDSSIIHWCLSYSEEYQRQIYIKKFLLNGSEWKNNNQITISHLQYATNDIQLEFAKIILQGEKWKGSEYIVEFCLKYVTEEVKNDFFKVVLKYGNWKKFSSSTVNDWLKSASEELRQKCYKDSVEENKIEDYNHLDLCLKYATDDIKQNFCKQILAGNNYKKMSVITLKNCLKHLPSDLKKNFYEKILYLGFEDNLTYVDFCLIWAPDNMRLNFCKKILGENNPLDKSIVDKYLFFASNEIQQKICNQILRSDEWKCYSEHFITLCLKHIANDNLREEFLFDYLQSNYWKINNNMEIVGFALRYYENKIYLPEYLHDFIKYIIDNIDNPKIEIYYLILLRVNFYRNDIWKKEIEEILQNWQTKPYHSVLCALYSNKFYPERTQIICEQILLHWKKEFFIESYFYDTEMYFNDQLELAIAHPYLKEQAKQTANEILKLAESKHSKMNDEFKLKLTEIVKNNIYPEWETSPKWEREHY